MLPASKPLLSVVLSPVLALLLGVLFLVSSCTNPSDDEESDANSPPSFGGLTLGTLTLEENSPIGTLVSKEIVVRVYDPDRDEIVLWVKDRNNNFEDSEEFGVNEEGNLFVRYGAVLDFETVPRYLLRLVASDGTAEAHLDFAIVLLDVEEPLFWSLRPSSTFVVDENAIEGFEVGRPLRATGQGGSIDYVLKREDGTDSPEFDVESDGQVVVRGGANLDYELQESYRVFVEASEGNHKIIHYMTILVGDVADILSWATLPPARLFVNENVPDGSLVGEPMVVAEHVEEVSYSLENADGSSSSAFVVDSNGQVSVRQGAVLSFERQSEHRLLLTATAGTNVLGHSLVVEVQGLDEPIDWEGVPPARLNVDENASPQTPVGSPFGVVGRGTALAYRLNNRDGSPSLEFGIDNQGQMRVLAGAVLSREAKPNYDLRITVVSGAHQLNHDLVVELVEGNGSPVWVSSPPGALGVVENALPGLKVGDPIVATDPEGVALAYDLTNRDGSPSLEFAIDSNGQVLVRQGALINYEGGVREYAVVVSASDGTNTLEHNLRVVVGDVDETELKFEQEEYTFYAFDRGSNTNMGRTPAMSGDAVLRTGRSVGLRLVDSVPEDLHSNFILGASGRLVRKLGSTLDATTNNQITLVVRAVDGPLTNNQEVTVVLAVDSTTIGERMDALVSAYPRILHLDGSLRSGQAIRPIPVVFGRDWLRASVVQLDESGRLLGLRVADANTQVTLPNADRVYVPVGSFASNWDDARQSLKGLSIRDRHTYRGNGRAYLFESNAALGFRRDGSLQYGNLIDGQRIQLGTNIVEFSNQGPVHFNGNLSIVKGLVRGSQSLQVGSETLSLASYLRFDDDGNIIEGRLFADVVLEGQPYAAGSVLRFFSGGALAGTGSDPGWTGSRLR